MRWKGLILMLFVLAFLTAPSGGNGEAAPAVGSAEIQAETAASEEEKYVALTFDDGPRADTTGRLLDGLKERGAVATFFLIGQQIPGNEALVQRMAAEGHQVGNHTYGHTRLKNADDQTILTEVAKTDTLLRELLGDGVYWLRPPYGQISQRGRTLVQVPMIQWTVDPEDWKLLDEEKVYQAVMEAVEPGAVILLHDFYPTSVDAALRVVDALQAQGYTFVTVQELFELAGEDAEPGCLYRAPGKSGYEY